MNIILNRCETCDDIINSKVKIVDNILHYKHLCSFCFRREKKIKYIQQKITNLEWELYCMEVKTIKY